MIIWGNYDRDRNEDTGRFECPQCGSETDFTLVRTWNYFHIYFIPIAKQQLVAERILCEECNIAFPITVLAGNAQMVESAFGSGHGSEVQQWP
ncbi:MAG: zinc-ribbon domain-containing protein [Planctomycetes bacterium]|nr:zinc-ribbon domain-containing protein [Planctomycetota bacterium]